MGAPFARLKSRIGWVYRLFVALLVLIAWNGPPVSLRILFLDYWLSCWHFLAVNSPNFVRILSGPSFFSCPLPPPPPSPLPSLMYMVRNRLACTTTWQRAPYPEPPSAGTLHHVAFVAGAIMYCQRRMREQLFSSTLPPQHSTLCWTAQLQEGMIGCLATSSSLQVTLCCLLQRPTGP